MDNLNETSLNKRNFTATNIVKEQKTPLYSDSIVSGSCSSLHSKEDLKRDSENNSLTQTSLTNKNSFSTENFNELNVNKKDYLTFSNDPENLKEIEMRLEKISCEIYEIKNLIN